MRVSILIALGLINAVTLHVSAADPQTNAPDTRYYYTQGGRNDPFMRFATALLPFRDALEKYDQLPSSSGVSERQKALNEVRLDALVLFGEPPTFMSFFVKSHLPPQALAVSKPLFDALKNESFQKEREKLVPNFEQVDNERLLSSWFERMDIDHLRRLYALYATLPFPKDGQLGQYEHAWNPPTGPHGMSSWR